MKRQRKISDDDDLMTTEEFTEHCKSGGFIDYDGFGMYSDGEYEYYDIFFKDVIHPSSFLKKKDHPYTHVVWFNN